MLRHWELGAGFDASFCVACLWQRTQGGALAVDVPTRCRQTGDDDGIKRRLIRAGALVSNENLPKEGMNG